MVLFISSGEIFIILLFILIFFGADKIPEFTRMMNKGMREFKKASDDIKREFTENTSGMMNELRSIQNDLTESLTKEIAEPVQKSVSETEKTFGEYKEEVQKTVNEAGKTFDEYQEQVDYYYQNPGDVGSSGDEYKKKTQTSTSENISDTSVHQVDSMSAEPVAEEPTPAPRKARTPKRRAAQDDSLTNSTADPSTKQT